MRLLAFLILLLFPFAVAAADPAETEFFEKKIRPVLVEHCYACHSDKAPKVKGSLKLDSREAILKGGDSGPAVALDHLDQSLILKAISYKDTDLQMPPRGKLPDATIADLTSWVKKAVPFPATAGSTSNAVRSTFDLAKRKADHWAWKPVAATAPPNVRNSAWPLDPIDQFILAKLEAKEIAPAAPADRRTWIRRVTFDLTGLPPLPADVDAFLKDESPQAFESVVSRLLASPHYGEHWARHWFDLVRYAESRGHEFDPNIPDAWQYRDYAIRAFNADVPYNQLVTEHVAGDLIERPRLHPTEKFNESILGTGFWFLGEEVHSPVDIRGDEADRFDNRIDVFSKTFLALTVSCARCHDHKFDAISTKDYYALMGFLQSSSYRLTRFEAMEENRKVAEELNAARARHRANIQKTIADAFRPGVAQMADYLTAAQSVISGSKAFEDVLAERNLDRKRLQAWVGQAKARRDDGPIGRFLSPKNEPPRSPHGLNADYSEVVIDYVNDAPQNWMPDGFSFGSGPVRPGELQFDGTPAKPAIRFAELAAAEKDPAWAGTELARDSELDYGALGSWQRPGRTLRTPTFTLNKTKVYYRVKGQGHVYAAVDSHIMIAGPLHGRLISAFNTGDKYQWVGLDLTPYQGHRLHLEFSWQTGAEFSLTKVVQSDKTPNDRSFGSPVAVPLSQGLPFGETVAACQKQMFALLDHLAKDEMTQSSQSAMLAADANWLLAHPELFAVDDQAFATAVKTAYGEQAKIIAKIRTQSHVAPTMWDGSGENEHVFIRGSHKALGEIVPRRFLEALVGQSGISTTHGSGRLELARQMTDPATNPFVARVIVNRVWHHLFGRGIVASTDNFGVMGEAPTHPELLDYLADRFVKENWSIKKLISALVLSQTYRQSSIGDPKADANDSENLLLHKARLRRLPGEAIRDAMLVASNRLNDRMFGPSVPIFLTEFLDGRGRPGASGPLDGDGRRSVYIAIRRNFLSPMMLAFDTPSPFSTVGRRSVSNVPAQALILMNDPFVHQQAERWGNRVKVESGTKDEKIGRMYETAFGRPPRAEEREKAEAFLERSGEAGWADLAHVLFNVKEFIYLP